MIWYSEKRSAKGELALFALFVNIPVNRNEKIIHHSIDIKIQLAGY